MVVLLGTRQHENRPAHFAYPQSGRNYIARRGTCRRGNRGGNSSGSRGPWAQRICRHGECSDRFGGDRTNGGGPFAWLRFPAFRILWLLGDFLVGGPLRILHSKAQPGWI